MADAKITALSALTSAQVSYTQDVFAVVSLSSTATRKILVQEAAGVLGCRAEVIAVALGNEVTPITATAAAVVTFRMPYAFTVSQVKASLTNASSSGTPTFDINESGTTILSTKLTIDATELTSATAAVPAVISDANLAADAPITIDIDVTGVSAAGAKVYLIGKQVA
ncbi:MAG: hypothetical protein Q7N50_02845 [Armatimonadota bacterium]|nr:hypothetical protein [Armatimonadota bacterium]